MTSLVWYACYGSNLEQERFMHYIDGGTPVGGTRDHPGTTDKTPPLATEAFDIPYSLYFAGESQNWGGGFALLSDELSDKPSLGRAYLVTLDQFEEIVAQESLRDIPEKIDPDLLKNMGQLVLGDGQGRYDKLLYCGELLDIPVITFTCTSPREDINKPSEAYLSTIYRGLTDLYQLTPSQAADYLADCPGIRGEYTHSQLATLFQG